MYSSFTEEELVRAGKPFECKQNSQKFLHSIHQFVCEVIELNGIQRKFWKWLKRKKRNQMQLLLQPCSPTILMTIQRKQMRKRKSTMMKKKGRRRRKKRRR